MSMIFLLFSTLPCELDSLLLKAVNLSYTENFAAADSLITIVREKRPAHPASYFFLASLNELRWVDRGEDSYVDKIFSWADTAIVKGKEWVKENPEDPWGYFFIGGSYTLKVFYYVMKEDYLGALPFISPAVDYLSKTKELDSCIVDVCLGLGSWKYFKGNFPFMRGEKKKGLQMIKKAISGAKYVSLYSALAYAKISAREKAYDECISVLLPLLDSFPDSRTFNWPLLKAYYGKKDYPKALETANKLVSISAENDFSNFEAHYYKTKILLELRRLEDAWRTIEAALGIDLQGDKADVEEMREELIGIRDEIERKVGKI